MQVIVKTIVFKVRKILYKEENELFTYLFIALKMQSNS